ncbi:DNA repair protein RadC [Povalibacter uvarum]|uniref:DNA repair protein RadC n=1 Tax=Povalibacter uvarum TaxID=732238 RepID=A0A841HV08_9GAMM|nr:DNA repair protein RadC [Povalibacter uvarum]MBB6095802.1 DNA repair protein RadC [Povalibacter uvarum]
MNTSKRSVHSLNVRSHSGAMMVTEPRYSTRFKTGVGESQGSVSDDEVIAAALRILSTRVLESGALSNPRVTREYLAVRFGGVEHEVFSCLYLDNRNRVMCCQELFRGTIDGASVHPREVVKEALAHNAAAVILVHNHPSGVAEPSQADELLTRRLKQALALVDIRVLDHLIVGDAVVESFAERGLL